MAPSVLIHLSVVGEAALKYVTSQIIADGLVLSSSHGFAVERGFTNAYGREGETLSCVVRRHAFQDWSKIMN